MNFRPGRRSGFTLTVEGNDRKGRCGMKTTITSDQNSQKIQAGRIPLLAAKVVLGISVIYSLRLIGM